MKTILANELEKTPVTNVKSAEGNKRRKNYTEQLLQFLARQTNSDRRVDIYGMDPFK